MCGYWVYRCRRVVSISVQSDVGVLGQCGVVAVVVVGAGWM